MNLAPREIAARYHEYAGLVRKHIPGVCNWFDFAAWGTYNVTLMMEVVGDPLAEVLRDGQQAIFRDVIFEAERFLHGLEPTDSVVGFGFECYNASLVGQGNLHLARREQELVQPCWDRVLGEMGPEWCSRMVVVWPNEALFPPQPYQDFDVRMAWIREIMARDLHNELLWVSPLEVTAGSLILA